MNIEELRRAVVTRENDEKKNPKEVIEDLTTRMEKIENRLLDLEFNLFNLIKDMVEEMEKACHTRNKNQEEEISEISATTEEETKTPVSEGVLENEE